MEPPSPKFALRGSGSPISSISFLHALSHEKNINYLASGTQDGNCYIWNLKVRGLERNWKAHKSSVLWMKCLSPDSLWTCGRSEAAILWDLGCGAPNFVSRFPIDEYLGFSHCDVIDHNFKSLLLSPGSSQESVCVWDTHTKTKVTTLKPCDAKSYGAVMQCKFIKHNENIKVLVVYESGHIVLWDTNMMKVVSEITCNENPVSIMYDHILKKGVCGTASEKVYTFLLNESYLLENESEYSITNPGIGCLSSRPDNKIYATGGWDYRIRIFSWKKHKPLAVLIYHKMSIECIQFSTGPVESFPEGYLLAAGSSDNSISLWDIYN